MSEGTFHEDLAAKKIKDDDSQQKMNIRNINKQRNKKRFGHICYQCNIPFRTNMKLQLHIKTSGHYPKRRGKNKAQANPKALKDTQQYTLKDFCNLSPNERGAIIGLEYVLEYRVHVGCGKKEVGYFCQLCMYDASLDRMVQHITGFRHRKIFLARKYPFVMKAVPSENSSEKKLFLKKITRQIEKEEGDKTYMVDEQSLKKNLNKSEISALKALSQTMPTKWSIEENTDLLMKTAIDYSEELEIDSDSEVNKVSTIMMQMAWRLRMYALRASPYNPFPERVAKAKEVAVAIIDSNIKNSETPEDKPDEFHKGAKDQKSRFLPRKDVHQTGKYQQWNTRNEDLHHSKGQKRNISQEREELHCAQGVKERNALREDKELQHTQICQKRNISQTSQELHHTKSGQKRKAPQDSQELHHTQSGKKINISQEYEAVHSTQSGQKWNNPHTSQEQDRTQSGQRPNTPHTSQELHWTQSKQKWNTHTNQELDHTQSGQKWNAPNTSQKLQSTQSGQKWNTPNANQKLQSTQSGQKWNTPNTSQKLQSTQSGQKWNTPNASQKLQSTQSGQKWNAPNTSQKLQSTQSGQKWNTPNASQKLQSTQSGQKWNTPNSSQELHSTQSGQKWIAPNASQELHNTQSGQKWIAPNTSHELHGTHSDQKWIAPNASQELHSTQSGQKWIAPNVSQELHSTQSGQKWIAPSSQKIHRPQSELNFNAEESRDLHRKSDQKWNTHQINQGLPQNKSDQKWNTPQTSQGLEMKSGSAPQKNETVENAQFLKRLKELMGSLTQKKSSENTPLNQKLTLLKTLLQNKAFDKSKLKQMMSSLTQSSQPQSTPNVSLNSPQVEPQNTASIMKNVLGIEAVARNSISMENMNLNQNLMMQGANFAQRNQSVNQSFQHTQKEYTEAYKQNMQGQKNDPYSRISEPSAFYDRMQGPRSQQMRNDQFYRLPNSSENPSQDPVSFVRERGIGRMDSYNVKHAHLVSDQHRNRSNSERGPFGGSADRSVSLSINTDGLPADILQKIQGKDDFVVAAIIDEYRSTCQLK